VEVTVIAPRSPEPKQFHFARTETVGQAARTAANAFGYGEGTPTFATAKRVILDRNETLAAAHVHNGETLHLVDVGGGV
jgi:hypothetical protein